MTDLVVQERIKSLEQRLASDPQTPLFARLASCYLQAGRASEALRLCDDGLALYPFYTTAHLVKGKALVELGMMAEAKHEYEVVHELLPTNVTLAKLAASIESGSPMGFSVPAVEEVGAEPEVAATTPPVQEEIVEEPQSAKPEETLQQEPQIVEEHAAPAEVISLPEPPVDQTASMPPAEPETVPVEEDSFGFQAAPVVEELPTPPGGYETPGLGVKETLQPETAASEFAPPPEPPVTTPESVEEARTPVSDIGFEIPDVVQPAQPILEETSLVSETIEPTPSATEDAFGLPIEAPPAAPVEEPIPPPEPLIEAAPLTIEAMPVPEPPIESAPPIAESTIADVPSAAGDKAPDWYEAFAQLQQPASESAEAPPSAPVEEENPFAIFGVEQAPTAAEGEPYEDFAARVRMEMFGTEDSVTLGEYLGSSAVEQTAPASDEIGDLAEKLKSSPRITPSVINYSEKALRSTTEGDASSNSGFVTPTLAEIYVKQGWFDDAIKAYRALVINKPAEKQKFEQRIVEIEGMKKKQ
jgi:hypothetical protein